MTRAYALRAPAIAPRLPRAAAARSARRTGRGLGVNLALFALVLGLVGSYAGAYAATVLAVGAVERAESSASQVAAELHDAERSAAAAGALSYGDAAAAGLTEVAPRFVAAAGAPAALSMNGR